MTYRVAAVSFLNTIPLIDQLVREPGAKVALELDLPSRLAGRLVTGQVDAGLVPVVEILRGGTGGILCPTGIACNGPVDSVALFANGDPAGLQKVFVDRGSRSSVALLRILLAEMHGIFPVFSETEPKVGRRLAPGEGMLAIGDRCFALMADLERADPDHLGIHDLGAMWKTLTGLPFVFAAWAASSNLAAGAPANWKSLAQLLTESRDAGLSRLDELAAREAGLGKLGHKGEATPQAIAYYFRTSLNFVLGDDELAGMRRFQALCRSHDLAPDAPFPDLLS